MWGWHDWGWGVLMMVAFWGTIVALAVWFIRGNTRSDRSGALDTLAERFARGEIDEAEYRERRSTLQGR